MWAIVMQIAICDDSQTDLQQLKGIIQEIMERYSVCYSIHEYESGEMLLDTSLIFHLVFLDIVMNGGKDGIEIGKQIYRKNRFARIIFQTNFGYFCKDAMNKSHAFAFLEKPLEPSEVEEQIKEFFERSDGAQEVHVEFRNVRYVLDKKEVVKPVMVFPVKEIVYFEYLKMQKEIKIVTLKNEFFFSEPMNELEKRMKPLGFEISCRGILVNLERISRIQRYNILLDTGSTVPLSQRRVTEFKGRMNEYIHDSFH